MNIFGSERVLVLTAKTCGPSCGNIKIVYLPIDSNHILCVDKKEIILSQLNACQKLLPHAQELDREVVEKEISELKMALELYSIGTSFAIPELTWLIQLN